MINLLVATGNNLGISDCYLRPQGYLKMDGNNIYKKMATR